MAQQQSRRRRHILSVALEDYFHGPAFANYIDRRHWPRFETRFEKTCLKVLDQLDEANAKATFFVNAWTAQSCPALSREVIRRGHEIGLAGARSSSFRTSTPEELRKRLRVDKAILETVCGRRILGYRVTDVLLSAKDLWALEILAEEGFSYDSSLSPFLWRFAGEAGRRHIHRNTVNGVSIWEVPLSSYQIGGLLFPIAGGNYFRQYPETLVRFALASCDRGDDPLVLYFRLWDFDPEQPHIEAGSMITQFRHYRNGERIVRTIGDVLDRYSFCSIAEYLQLEQALIPLEEADEKVAFVNAVVPEYKLPGELLPVSVIIPCYNEQSAVPYLVNSLDELKIALKDEYDLQFILVDDGSKDGTWQALNKHFAGRADSLLLQHSKNRGVAGAISTGLEQAREIACSMDCDCSYDPMLIRPMLQMMAPGVDVVTASPYHPSGSVKHVPGWRLFLSKGASALYRLVTGKKLHTFTACLRVYRRSAVAPIQLRHSGFLGVAELIGHVAQRGGVILEFPATLESRIFGRSKMKVLRTTIGHLGLLRSLAWTRLRGQAPNKPIAGKETSEGTTSSSAVSAAKL